MLTQIHDFHRQELQRHGLGDGTIRLDRDAADRLVVHEVPGTDRWADSARGDGRRIRAECLPVLPAQGIDIDRETIMISTNLASWDAAAGRAVDYDVSLTDVESLELCTEDGGDGNGNDWGDWLGPVLTRC